MNLKEKITHFLNNGISAWTGEKNVRFPEVGNPVFLELLENYKDELNYDGIKKFFEAGTYNGCNAIDFSNIFDAVITTEIDADKYASYCEKEKIYKNIQFVLGDATLNLEKVLSNNPEERLVILLDDHTDSSTFILQELEAIKNNSKVDHIIIIDDVDKLDAFPYPTHKEIVDLVNSCQQNYKIVRHNHKFLIFKSVK